jgi:O-methyltransferase involved in polyketide biosynthesis
MTQGAPQEQQVPAGLALDPTVPNPARIWNFWVGGKDHFEADRALAEQFGQVVPQMPLIARLTRSFIADTVRRLAAAGIRQFLDIGTGLPTADNTHEVAQRLAPPSRIVYVDNDPVVLAHARALLTSSPEGKTAYLDADLRDPTKILDQAAEILDLSKPVAILLIAVLHFIQDSDDPYRIVRTLMDAVPSGSYLVLLHAASDVGADDMPEAERRYNEQASAKFHARDREHVSRFFDGLELAGPGLVNLSRWAQVTAGDGTAHADVAAYCGLARKP